MSEAPRERWLRIIPVALVMYTISYVDRTNVALAFDPQLSTAMLDLGMDDKTKGHAIGIFFWGYLLLQMPGGYLASHWSARKLITVCLAAWGAAAFGCGMVTTAAGFRVMRFLLGMAESGVYPATLVLLTHWFPRGERARANAFWNLCQPLAVAGAAPVTGALLNVWGWRAALKLEGLLPFLWLPIWWLAIRDHPRQAKWISREEKDFLETTLAREASELPPTPRASLAASLAHPAVWLMVPICFFMNACSYGCNTFLSDALKSPNRKFTGLETGLLFSVPYLVTAVTMVLVSRHSDRQQERRMHVAAVYAVSGLSLIASVAVARYSFWLSFAFLCFAIPGPFAGLAPFFAMFPEMLPAGAVGAAMGFVNALGNFGGWAGPAAFGWLKQETGGTAVPFCAMGGAILVSAALCFLLPKTRRPNPSTSTGTSTAG